MFENLPYKSKIEICRLFYCDKFIGLNIPKTIIFSWSWVEYESVYGFHRVKRIHIVEWYKNNLKIIRKHKLLNIAKKEM